MTRNRVFLSRRDPVVCAWLTATALLLTVALVLLFLSLLQDAEIQVHANAAPQRQNLDQITPTSTTTTTTVAPKRQRRGAAWPTDELLLALAMCETGQTMDQKITSPNGRYFSYFQWDLATWREAGGEGHPHDASYAYQRSRARHLILRPGGGWGRWPHCSRAIGAR